MQSSLALTDFDQALPKSKPDQIRGCPQSQLLHNVLSMRVYRLGTDKECLCDFGRRLPFSQHEEDFTLPGTEGIQRTGGPAADGIVGQ